MVSATATGDGPDSNVILLVKKQKVWDGDWYTIASSLAILLMGNSQGPLWDRFFLGEFFTSEGEEASGKR